MALVGGLVELTAALFSECSHNANDGVRGDFEVMCVYMQVVHGGDNDVLWLQRDYHIYMVNVFDTEKACQVHKFHSKVTWMP